MKWPWQREKLRPGDVLVRCPECHDSFVIRWHSVWQIIRQSDLEHVPQAMGPAPRAENGLVLPHVAARKPRERPRV